MSKLVWDETGKKYYETGTKMAVLYNQVEGAYTKGTAWNGFRSFEKRPSGAEPTALWADDAKYLTMMSAEEFGATIGAYTYPDEFNPCIGYKELTPGVLVGQQEHEIFGLCVRTTIGNDVKGNEYGYKLHLVYGAQAAPSEVSYNTINDSPEAIELSWELSTTPVVVEGFKPTSYIEIDSTKVPAEKLAALEEELYGSESKEAHLPLPDEVKTLLSA